MLSILNTLILVIFSVRYGCSPHYRFKITHQISYLVRPTISSVCISDPAFLFYVIVCSFLFCFCSFIQYYHKFVVNSANSQIPGSEVTMDFNSRCKKSGYSYTAPIVTSAMPTLMEMKREAADDIFRERRVTG